MRKVISYSLWGDSSLYCDGAIDNVAEAKKIFPDWICRFYVASDCPALDILKTLDCEVVEMPAQKGIDRSDEKWTWQIEHCGMFWRYFILDEMGSDDVTIFRDCDSLPTRRDAWACNEWLATDYLSSCQSPPMAMRIHENQAHWNAWAMGGMWGFRGPELKGCKESIETWIEIYPQYKHPYIFIDLEWINKILGPSLNSIVMSFGYGHSIALPPLQAGEQFVGEVNHPERRKKKFSKEDYLFKCAIDRNLLVYDEKVDIGHFTKKAISLANLAIRKGKV